MEGRTFIVIDCKVEKLQEHLEYENKRSAKIVIHSTNIYHKDKKNQGGDKWQETWVVVILDSVIVC